ncbi:hypothetical protein [Phyllobacterium lublinensis]|uniref:hypothetical protein n=1 Tax=Phyllobacterium lublinensis TaxID=2875708 RepID=UPI001CCA3C00|nr:hypothetical protein [Phyllobacterium sp. 2063]MBZ9653561.1 hypothetical protein [Phyllobacterium sp. 2063]
MAVKPDYTAGTVSVSAGGTVVTGVGSFWVAADIQPGDTFKVKNLDAIILSVDSNNQITLKEAWTGGALAASAYAIRYQPDGSRFTAATRELIEQLGNGNVLALSGLTGALDEIPVFTGAGAMTTVSKQELTKGIDVDAKVETLAERDAYDGQAEGFTVLVADVGDGRSAVYFKASNTLGDWSEPAFLTGPNGSFQSKGNYSGATAYVLGDVVRDQGSSWVAKGDTTGNAPPSLPTDNNTWWELLAEAGNGFVFRGDYSGATAYVKDDVVFDQNSSWIALQATTGNAPPTLPTTSNANWKAIAVRGAGDVSGPAISVDGRLVEFDGTSGKAIKDGGVTISTFVKTLLDDASAGAFRDTLGGVGAVRQQAFVTGSPTTYTPHANMIFCIIECIGGGGAGGGVLGVAGQQCTASGGGGGGYSRKLATKAQVGASQSLTIGAGGVTGGATAGGNGGATSVGTLCKANGGTGGPIGQSGVAISNGGPGGSVTGAIGDIQIPGGDGGGGMGSANTFLFCGWGGGSFYAGQTTPPLAANGNPGKVLGGGGSAGNSLGATSYAGGNGATGAIIITEFCSS